jgi:hypothetical protein
MPEVGQLIAHFAGHGEYPAQAIAAVGLIDERAHERRDRLDSTAFVYCRGIQQYRLVSAG